MSNTPNTTPESPEQQIDVQSLLTELESLDTEQKTYNYLRTVFIDPLDVDQFITDLSVKDGKYKNLNFRQVKLLIGTLTGFKTHLLKYLKSSGKRIQKMEERNIANASELAEHAGETELEEKLQKTRRRISKAMKFAKKQVNGKTLKEVATSTTPIENKNEILTELLKTLQARFEANMNRHPTIKWSDVEKKLRQATPEKLQSLKRMEETGGEPDVVIKEGNDYVFYDCSAESPIGRRNICYDGQSQQEAEKRGEKPACNAVDMAKEMGIEILNQEQYINILQKLGTFDVNSWNWIKTSLDKRSSGVVLRGYRNGVGGYYPDLRNAYGGFRGLLRV